VTPNELQHYLYEEIPLSRAMAVRVLSVDPTGVVLEAPLEPNINQHHSVFGGSASAVAMLASWTLLYARLRADEFLGNLLIQRNSMEFKRPIVGRFTARAALEQPQRWQHFIGTLQRRGKARVAVGALLQQQGGIAARFSGEFVALNAHS
jgi:thioesterase domain-containing protein